MSDVRPFFGETEEVVGENIAPEPPDPRRFGDYEQRRRWYMDEGCCPRPGCHVPLDDGACSQCGWTLADEKAIEPTPEMRDDYVPRLPGLWDAA